ncbi:OmpW family outer membrane protein [Flavobacterium sp. UMI-01]|uniref:OmpW family outer membrane protein n=1 Tax=Flavobacterium sp. UMI-01 TaxID=1441053 RepID=UPI001C7E02EA|nr:OmpW family outer membrane protein [Flavobacterium sp. UMI-01]GIZ09453.1 hypothetical protein FUMI01_21800 [Flavobacterium sp. UMI-01]
MKKVILSAVALLAISFAKAQDGAKDFNFSKGNILVEGNLGFASTNDKNTEEKTNSFIFTPQAGYFLTDKFAVGVKLGFASYKEEESGVDTDKGNAFSAGVFGRYYFLDLGQRFKTYVNAGVDFVNSKEGLAEIKENGVNVGAGIGVNYFVTDCILLNFGLTNILSYQTSKVDLAGAKSESSFGVNLNGNVANPFATASFGVAYKF